MIFFIFIVLVILSVYLSAALLSFVFSAFAANGLKDFEQEYITCPYDNQLAVLVYAHNDEKAVVSLLERLNKQNYSKSDYQINIILDNCEDNSSNILEFVGGAKIWRVGEDEQLGKDAAISWVLERLVSFQNVNAYVFLDVNSEIDDDFLLNINRSLFSADVLVGNTELVCENPSLLSNIKSAYNKYSNSVLNTGRSFLFNGLSAVIDSSITVIKQEVLEKVKCIDFQNPDSELKYTTLLVKNGIVPRFAPLVKIKLKADNYEFNRPSFKRRVTLFLHCLSLLFGSNLKFVEHVFNLIRPNWLVTLLISAIMVSFVVKYANAPLTVSALTYLILPLSLITFIVSVFKIARLKISEVFYLCLFPILNIVKKMNKFPSLKKVTDKLFKQRKSVQVLEKFSVDVVVSGGQKSFKCKLDIVKEQDFSKAVFIFKKKKYISASYLKVYDAVNEIIEKLDERGFRLKICQTCGYFCPKFDMDANELRGLCHCNKMFNIENHLDEELPIPEDETFYWNLCEKYIPKEIHNVIDMSTYRQI